MVVEAIALVVDDEPGRAVVEDFLDLVARQAWSQQQNFFIKSEDRVVL